MDEQDLKQLELEAAAIDASATGQEFTEQAAIELPSVNESYRGAIMQFLGFAVGLVNERVIFTRQHFTPDALDNIASSLIKVADVEGLDLNKLLGDPNSRIGAWLSLAFAVGMPSFTFWLAIQEYKKQQQVKPETSAPGEANKNPISNEGALMPAMELQ